MRQLQKGREREKYVPITTLFATCNHMQTSSESSVEPLRLYMIQSLHGKRLFNNLPCEWKHPVIHPTMPCALFDPSSIRGACLTTLALLLLALAPPRVSALATGLAMPLARLLPDLGPLSPLSLSLQLLAGGKSSLRAWYFAVFF